MKKKMKKDEIIIEIEMVSIEVKSKEDKATMERALKLLDDAGYKICKKDSFVVEKDCEVERF